MASDMKSIRQDSAQASAAMARVKADCGTILDIAARDRTQDQKDKLDALKKELSALEQESAQLAEDLVLSMKLQDNERREGASIESAHVVVGEDLAAQQPFGNLGEQLQAIHAVKMGTGRGETVARLMAAAQGAGEAVDSDGGFLLQPTFQSAIESKMFEEGQILSRCRQLAVGPNSNSLEIKVVDDDSRATGSRWGGVRGYWVDEGSAPTASNPKFGKLTLKLNKVAALGYASDELLEDSVAMSSIFEQAFGEELTFLTEDAVFNGTGAGQPQGIIGHAHAVSVAKETGQAATTIVFANVVKMFSRLWARSRSASAWFVNQDVEPQLNSMTLSVGTGGVPVYLPANGISGAPFATLFGRPVIPVEYAATLGTVGDVVLADLSQYGLLTKGGVKQASSLHVAFTTDEMAFRATYRVDGQPLWKSALTPFKGSATQSPTITLATRS